jgi:signal transduction histidine kinase
VLAPHVDLAAYRIVQEALTNVRRHSAAGSATVALGFEPTQLTLAIRDAGPHAAVRVAADPATAAGDGHEGHGLQGMRERAAALGGHLVADTAEDGGFVVLATLPTAGSR